MSLEDKLSFGQRPRAFSPVILASEAFNRMLAQNPSRVSEMLALGINPDNFSYKQLETTLKKTQRDYLNPEKREDYLGVYGQRVNFEYDDGARAQELQEMEELIVNAYSGSLLNYETLGTEFQGIDMVRARNGLKEFLKHKLGLIREEPNSKDYKEVAQIVSKSTNYKLLESLGVQAPTTEDYQDLRPSPSLKEALKGPINPKFVLGAEPLGGATTVAMSKEHYHQASGSKLNRNSDDKYHAQLSQNPLYMDLLKQAEKLVEEKSYQDKEKDDDKIIDLVKKAEFLELATNYKLPSFNEEANTPIIDSKIHKMPEYNLGIKEKAA